LPNIVTNSTNAFAQTRFTVDPTPGNAQFTTIQDAVNAAQNAGAGTIWINPGTYTESPVITGTMDLIGNCGFESLQVMINGNISVNDWTNSITFSNLIINASSSDGFDVSSSTTNSTQISFNNCIIISSGNGITFSATGGSDYTAYLNNANIQSSSEGIVHNGSAGPVIITNSSINASSNGIDTNGIEFELYNCQMAAGANGVIFQSSSALVIEGGFFQSTNELLNFNGFGGDSLIIGALIECSAGSGYFATSAGTLLFSDLSFIGSARGIDPAITKFPLPQLLGLPTIPGGIITQPTDSSTATSAFGSSLSFGSAKQNTTGYDILVNIFVLANITATGTINLGVGPTSSPATNPVTPSLPLSPGPFQFSAIVPNNYYIVVSTTGTVTQTSITIQVCPL
jgi:hypothetical protein